MNTKNVIRVLLLVFVVASAATLLLKKSEEPAAQETATAATKAVQAAPDALQDGIVVYYFYTTRRCMSCKKIEAFTAEAVKTTFAKELASGSIQWKTFNVDEPQNKHYLKDYELFTKSVIVSEIKGGKEARWKNLEDVWELLGDPGKFQQYVVKEIEAYRGGGNG